jgi:hypothetical protein
VRIRDREFSSFFSFSFFCLITLDQRHTDFEGLSKTGVCGRTPLLPMTPRLAAGPRSFLDFPPRAAILMFSLCVLSLEVPNFHHVW